MLIPHTPHRLQIGLDPITTVTPFTYRAGSTYLSILEALAKYLNELSNYVSDLDKKIVDAVNQSIADMIAQVEKSIADSQTLTDEKIAELERKVELAIESVINSSIELQDRVAAGLVDDPDTLTRKALDEWLAPQLAAIVSEVNTLKSAVWNVASEVGALQEDNKEIRDELAEGLGSLASSIAGLHIANPTAFGAVGDGVTDDTLAIQKAADELARVGGGVLAFDKKRYFTREFVRLASNTRIEGNGATITKRGIAIGESYITFVALGGKGSIENISISNMRFEGNLPGNGVMVLWAHRLRVLRVRNVTVTDAITNGHCFDLQGCDDVKISSSVFSGAFPTVGREYAEAIQVDTSMRVGSPDQRVETETYDGTPSRNITVEDCRFVRQGTYLAPRAFGSHSVVQGKQYQGLTFINNYVETPSESTTRKGVLNFVGADDVLIRGNEFAINPGLDFPYVVGFQAATFWIRQSDVNTPNAEYVTATNEMRGIVLDVGGNKYPQGYPRTTWDFTIPTYEVGFKAYDESNGQPRVYATRDRVSVLGLLGKIAPTNSPESNIEGSTEIPAFRINPALAPKRVYRAIQNGSVSETYMLTVYTDGLVRVNRYSGSGRSNPFLTMSLGWDRA